GQAEQIETTRDKFVTALCGLAGCVQEWVGEKPPERKNPTLSRRAEEPPRLARSCSERFKLA
ncbi:MAG: hypothetical protein ACREDA_08765, partial [Methylocella sp.]